MLELQQRGLYKAHRVNRKATQAAQGSARLYKASAEGIYQGIQKGHQALGIVYIYGAYRSLARSIFMQFIQFHAAHTITTTIHVISLKDPSRHKGLYSRASAQVDRSIVLNSI
jgi:hypothetical protein